MVDTKKQPRKLFGFFKKIVVAAQTIFNIFFSWTELIFKTNQYGYGYGRGG